LGSAIPWETGATELQSPVKHVEPGRVLPGFAAPLPAE
jgi:hypothetical protein